MAAVANVAVIRHQSCGICGRPPDVAAATVRLVAEQRVAAATKCSDGAFTTSCTVESSDYQQKSSELT